MATKIKGGGARKRDRNRIWCKAYAGRNQREKNKRLRIIRHLKVFSGDTVAKIALDNLNAIL